MSTAGSAYCFVRKPCSLTDGLSGLATSPMVFPVCRRDSLLNCRLVHRTFLPNFPSAARTKNLELPHCGAQNFVKCPLRHFKILTAAKRLLLPLSSTGSGRNRAISNPAGQKRNLSFVAFLRAHGVYIEMTQLSPPFCAKGPPDLLLSQQAAKNGP